MKKALGRALLVVIALTAVSPAGASAKKRSLEEFLAVQGTFCFPDGAGGCYNFLDPLPNMLGWMDTEENRRALVDYAGLADTWLTMMSGGLLSLGTTIMGTVKEHVFADGSAEIVIRLVTSNALVFTVSGCDIAAGPLQFGRRGQEVLAGATASLADITFVFKHTVPVADMPLKDLVAIVSFPEIGENLAEAKLKGESYGELRAGFGVPDGTPGLLTIKEKLIFDTPSGIPMIKEKIELTVIDD